MTSHAKLFRITLPISTLGLLTPHVVGFAGPVEHAPFGNQLIFTALLALWFFTRYWLLHQCVHNEHSLHKRNDNILHMQKECNKKLFSIHMLH
jgi:hypothetical protein